MKKHLLIWTLALFVLGLVSCNSNDINDPNVKFAISVTDITAESVTISITPLDTTMYYDWGLHTVKRLLSGYNEDSVAAEWQMRIELYEKFDMQLEFPKSLCKGNDTFTYSWLEPETEYAIYAVQMDSAYRPVGQWTLKKFTTPVLNTSSYSSIFFEEESLELLVGKTEQLHLQWIPSAIRTAPDCTFESSNEEVATVDENGVVTAVAVGEAQITATYGQLSAVCPVTVKTVQDMIKWAGCEISYSITDEEPLSDTVEIDVPGLGRVKVLMYNVYCAYVWDQNVEENNAGFELFAYDVPVYVLAEGEHKGAFLNMGRLTIVDPDVFNPHDTAFAYCAPAGRVGDPQKWYDLMQHLGNWSKEDKEEFKKIFTGVILYYIDYDKNESYPWGLAGEGTYTYSSKGCFYQSNVTWFANQYGLLQDENGDFVQPAQWAPTTHKYYENLPPQSAPKPFLAPRKVVKRNNQPVNKLHMLMDMPPHLRR